MSGFIPVNGELVPKSEALDCARMMLEDAKRRAGHFHTKNRSPKFRANWPDEKVFAEANWKSFIEDIREQYGKLLGRPDVSEYDKRRIHIAIVVHDYAAQGAPKDTRLQIRQGTQQFVGDSYENKKITTDFGKHSNTFRDLLMASAGGGARYH